MPPELTTSIVDGGPIILALGVISILSLILLVLAVKATLTKSTGKERLLWIVSFLFVPIICPAIALIYFRGKAEL